MDGLEKLRKLAQSATPGPWSQANLPYNVISLSPYEGHTNIITHGCDQPDARYIAAANPRTVLALLDVAQAVTKYFATEAAMIMADMLGQEERGDVLMELVVEADGAIESALVALHEVLRGLDATS